MQAVASTHCSCRPLSVVSRRLPTQHRLQPRRTLLVQASQQQPKPVPVQVAAAIDLFLKRYDVVSTGVGALAVTAYCVARGQDPFSALSLAFGATILGLVLNELMWNDDN